MELSIEEIVRYLQNGSRKPEGALATRIAKLLKEAPIKERKTFARRGDEYLICATVGAEFDVWQRRLAVKSAADAMIAQAIGAAAVERLMDESEREIAGELKDGERLAARRSPGYPGIAMERNREILEFLDAGRKIGVSTTGTMTLIPMKSVAAMAEVKRCDI